MSIWQKTNDLMPPIDGYESPITLRIRQISEQIAEQRDDAILMQVREQMAVDIDKNELARALNYDRDQYEKGYRNGRLRAEDEFFEKMHQHKKQLIELFGITAEDIEDFEKEKQRNEEADHIDI